MLKLTCRESSSSYIKSEPLGFTIVELLVVIVIIGILAAISVVSYRGLSTRANEAATVSGLATAKNQFELYYTEHNVYPTGLDENNCPTNASVTPTDTKYCLKPSNGTTYILNPDANSLHYTIRAAKDTLLYSISDTRQPAPTVAIDSNWITIGSQTWAKTNLNTGTMIAGTVDALNNGIVEKYCYDNNEANCTANGALYSWKEAMGYSNAENSQGICPAGSHIPSDNDLKILEIQLNMSQAEADKQDVFRGTNQGAQLKIGGTSGLNVPLAGYSYDETPYGKDRFGHLWSSTGSGSFAWGRSLDLDNDAVYRDMTNKAMGLSVRCLGN